MLEEEMSAMNMDQLQAAKKKSRTVLSVLGVLMVVLSAALVYYAVKSESTALLAIPICMFITLLPIGARLSRINVEIKKRT